MPTTHRSDPKDVTLGERGSGGVGQGLGLILRPALPESEKRDGEFARDGDHGALLGRLAAAGGDAFAGRAQVRGRAEGTPGT